MKTFIIHLSKIMSSLESASKLQTDLKKINIDAELFEGTYGSEAEDLVKAENRKVHHINFKGNQIDPRGIAKASRPGVIGCFYSHYRLWKKCIELNETVCIFEDDVKIIRPLHMIEFNEVLVIALGAVKKRKYIHYLENPTGDPNAMDYYHASMPGAVGYLIKPNAAKKLINYYKDTYLSADNAINQAVVEIQIHNYLIGEANLDKQSLTKASNFWRAFNNQS